MRHLFLIIIVTLWWGAQPSWAQGTPQSLRLATVSIEGPIDSVTVRLQADGWTPWGQSDDGEDYYFRGQYYGLHAKLLVTIDSRSRLVQSAYVTVGPYRTEQMLQRNFQYFLRKLQQQYGDLLQRDDAYVMLSDYGSIKLSVHDTTTGGSSEIRVVYVLDAPYYKDARNFGLSGPVQEVVTENAVSEDQFLHFSPDGQLENADLQQRQYDGYGYLRQARITEKQGYSIVTYYYNALGQLQRKTLENPVAHVTYDHQYTYGADGELQTENQRVWQGDDCVLTITLRYNPLTRDAQGNWTTNSLTLTYWEQGTQSQQTTVLQKRTISYYE